MKFNSRHLVAASSLLLGSVLYNVWVFWGPSADKKPSPVAVANAGTLPSVASAALALDPIKIPAPPHVDLSIEPVWTRDPFTNVGDGAKLPEVTVVAAAVGPDPVVGAILFSPERKLAIINGRIFVIGDRIETGVIVDIARDAIVVRGPAGESRRFALSGTKK